VKRGFADWIGCAALAVLCFAVAGIGGAVTAPQIDSWHAHLNKPSFNPPNAVFGPVWTVLYFLMAIAAGLVWLRRAKPGASIGLALFLVQLALNLAWTFLFFGWHRLDLASYEVVILAIVIAATLIVFLRVHALAAALLVPYLAWTAFASVLCWTFWHLNP
jgi:tryptophan-rich sensory protein